MSQNPLTPAQIRAVTEARVTLGPRTRAVTTGTALAFALDHARAREAVMSGLDLAAISAQLARAGLTAETTQSAAANRDTFVRRPDLGRQLAKGQHDELAKRTPTDIVLVLGDGLSAVAVALNGAAFITALSARLTQAGLSHGSVILARQARVALGDKIALAARSQTVVMALGERPGLSAADSLGVYVTHNPTAETADSLRNCISNIRDAGLDVQSAADQCLRLILAMRATGQSGVALSQHMAREKLATPQG